MRLVNHTHARHTAQCIYFFFNHTATTDIYTLSLHDALPISYCARCPPLDDPPTDAAEERFCCRDRKSTRLNSSHVSISYAVFCLKKKKNTLSPHRSRSMSGGELTPSSVLP